MGTNFYFISKNKEAMDKWFGKYNYEITDTPFFCYEAHITKISIGWLPLFQGYKQIRSVADIKKCYDTGEFQIFDEYNKEYTWEQFEKDVVNHNGGYLGAVKREKVDLIIDGLPEYRPVSHLELNDGYTYFKDDKGYEFYPDDFL